MVYLTASFQNWISAVNAVKSNYWLVVRSGTISISLNQKIAGRGKLVRTKNFKYPDKAAHELVMNELGRRGITMKTIAEIAFELQKDFYPAAQIEEFYDAANEVLHKREVLNNAMVALELDRLATEDKLQQPLQNIVANDSGVFGVDEALAVSIANIYGTIGVTNFGYLDRVKNGVIKDLDTQKDGRVNTFIDDLVGALAAAVAAKMAHQYA